MDTNEKAEYIQLFMLSLYNSAAPVSFRTALQNITLDVEEIRQLEYAVEDLGIVDFVQGRNNSTLNGECLYLINIKGRRIIDSNFPIIKLLDQNKLTEINDASFSNKHIERFLVDSGVNSNQISNKGQLIINYNSTIRKQYQSKVAEGTQSRWSKPTVIIVLIVVIFTIAVILHQIIN